MRMCRDNAWPCNGVKKKRQDNFVYTTTVSTVCYIKAEQRKSGNVINTGWVIFFSFCGKTISDRYYCSRVFLYVLIHDWRVLKKKKKLRMKAIRQKEKRKPVNHMK